VKAWDAIIVGAGIIGLSLAIELRKKAMSVLVVERGQPGREASWAAGGMLADCGLEVPVPLRELATASARMYPEFVHELEDESGLKIDLRDQGTLLLSPECEQKHATASNNELSHTLRTEEIQRLEPSLRGDAAALFLQERSVDPRGLTTAAIAAAKHRSIDLSSGDEVLEIKVDKGQAFGVRTVKTSFSAALVINCAGAWAGQIGPQCFPTRPVKGQMLCVAMPRKDFLRHVVRSPDVYLIPRSDGRLLIGATAEEAGFDKQTVPETIQNLRRAALELLPELENAKILEAWAGLRPGSPDNLPLLGATNTPGYFGATGHFRDGILLAPVTAKVMADTVAGNTPSFDMRAFVASRFEH